MLFTDFADFQVVGSQSFLKLERPFPGIGFFFCIEVNRSGKCQSHRLGSVQEAPDVEERRTLPM